MLLSETSGEFLFSAFKAVGGVITLGGETEADVPVMMEGDPIK